MQLPANTRERIADIRSTHKPTRVRSWGLFVRKVCRYCGQSWQCTQIVWAERVEAGQIEPAGWRP